MDLDKKTKIYLIIFGSIVGISFGCLVGFIVKKIVFPSNLSAGAEFENISDFRRAMIGHDERDIKENNNVSLRTMIEPNDSDLIIYTLKPNLDVKFEDVNVKTNSFGLRGPEITKEKPADVYRIAMMGDSFVFGWGVDEDKIFTRVLETELNKINKLNDKRAEVLNFGVPGYSTFQEVALFQEKAVNFNPDAVIVYFVENDFGLPFFIKNFSDPDKKLVNNSHFEEIREKVDDQVEDNDNIALLKNLDANRTLKKLDEFCQQKGVKLFLVINPNKKVPELEKKLWVLNDTKFLKKLSLREDVLSKVKEMNLTPEQLRLPKDPHPSAIKHQIIGEVMAKHLLNNL